MKQLTKWQSIVYALGGMIMVIGAGLCVLLVSWAPYIYSIGALAFTSMQMLQRYDGPSVTLRRLRRILLLSDFLLLLTAVLMFASKSNFFGVSQIVYVQYIYNKWIATLMLAAIIQLYAIHRIDHELKR